MFGYEKLLSHPHYLRVVSQTEVQMTKTEIQRQIEWKKLREEIVERMKEREMQEPIQTKILEKNERIEKEKERLRLILKKKGDRWFELRMKKQTAKIKIW